MADEKWIAELERAIAMPTEGLHHGAIAMGYAVAPQWALNHAVLHAKRTPAAAPADGGAERVVERLKNAIAFPALNADLLRAALPYVESAARAEARAASCTGVAASWCPNCGTCTCRPGDGTEEGDEEDPLCPLHGRESQHAEPAPSAAQPGDGELRSTLHGISGGLAMLAEAIATGRTSDAASLCHGMDAKIRAALAATESKP